MCTVTIIPLLDPEGRAIGMRLATNRDESRQRPAAEPPRVHERTSGRSIWPIDPVGGGTWIGVNEAGVIATLLNRNDGSPGPTVATRSRGAIVPLALEHETAGDAAQRIAEIDAREFLPFTAVFVDRRHLVRVAANGERVALDVQPWRSQPEMLTSSGLGDALVETPRRRLFEGWFGAAPSGWAAEQDAFQRHRWPERPHLSVNMSRPDARTVSLTIVEVSGGSADLAYWDPFPQGPSEPVRCSIALRGAPR